MEGDGLAAFVALPASSDIVSATCSFFSSANCVNQRSSGLAVDETTQCGSLAQSAASWSASRSSHRFSGLSVFQSSVFGTSESVLNRSTGFLQRPVCSSIRDPEPQASSSEPFPEQPSTSGVYSAEKPQVIIESQASDVAYEVTEPSDVLESAQGIDYTTLQTHLINQDFLKADAETRRILCELGGDISKKRQWLYCSQYTQLPIVDMHTMDALWVKYSNGRFGYSVQYALWMDSKENWERFLNKIGWKFGFGVENVFKYKKWPSEYTYTLEAPKGHLPLTNHIRGNLGHLALLRHKAWVTPRETSS